MSLRTQRKAAPTIALVVVSISIVRVTSADTLTLDAALELAAHVNPDVRAAGARLDAADAAVDQARVGRHPTVTLTGSAGAAGLVTAGDTTTSQLGLGVQASWRIYDFGKTGATIDASELDRRAEKAAVGIAERDVRYAVTTAYLEAIARDRLLAVARAALAAEDRHLAEARAFVAAGTRDPIESAQAESRRATAAADVIRAEGDSATALSNLWAAIGSVDVTRQASIDPAWPAIGADLGEDAVSLIERANRNRGEIARDDLQLSSAERRVDAANASDRPTLSVAAATEATAIDGDLGDPSWSIGLILSWPLVDGGAAEAATHAARASRNQAGAAAAASRVAIASEVNGAVIAVRTGRAALDATEAAAKLAREQLRQAEGRYRADVGSAIELADAQAQVTTAEGNVVHAEWTLAVARARLVRAVEEAP